MTTTGAELSAALCSSRLRWECRLDRGCWVRWHIPAAVHFSGCWARCRCNPARGLGGRDAGVKPTWTYSRRPLAGLHRCRFVGKLIRGGYK